MACNNEQAKAGMGGLFMGFVMGLVTGILYAPKSGEETRADIAKKVSDAQAQVADTLKKGQDKAAKELENIRKKLNTLGDKTGDAYAQGKRELEDKISKLAERQSKIDELEERIKKLEK